MWADERLPGWKQFLALDLTVKYILSFFIFFKSSFKFLLLINAATFQLDLFSSSAFPSRTNRAQFALTGKCAAQLPSAFTCDFADMKRALEADLGLCCSYGKRQQRSAYAAAPLCATWRSAAFFSPHCSSLCDLIFFFLFDFFLTVWVQQRNQPGDIVSCCLQISVHRDMSFSCSLLCSETWSRMRDWLLKQTVTQMAFVHHIRSETVCWMWW